MRFGGAGSVWKKRKRRGFWETLRICAERHATRSSGRAGCRVLLKSTWWGSFDDHNRSLMPSVDSRLSLRLELAEIPLIKQPPIRNHRHALESRPSIVAPTKKTTLVPTSSREEANRGREGGGKASPRFHSLPIHSRTSHEPIGFSKRRSSKGWIDRTSATSRIDEERRDERFKTRVQRSRHGRDHDQFLLPVDHLDPPRHNRSWSGTCTSRTRRWLVN